MSNLTITIDDQLLRAARVKAVQQGTSVNEICRQAIIAFALGDDAAEAAQAGARADAFWALSDSIDAGPRQSRARRDELYEEMLAQRSPPASVA